MYMVSGYDVGHKKIYPVDTRLGSIYERRIFKKKWSVNTRLGNIVSDFFF